MTTPNLKTVATLTPAVLCSVQVGSGDTAVYTVPSSSAVKVSTATLCNTSGATVMASVSLVPSGGTLDGSHKVISSFGLITGETTSLKDELGGAMLGAGDYINVNCDTGSALDVVITGTVMA